LAIKTIFANMSCCNLKVSEPWYENLFGKSASRHPMQGLAEWDFSDSAQVQLYEAPQHAGHCTLTIGVTFLESERSRLISHGVNMGAIEETKDFYITKLKDPDDNVIVLAGSRNLNVKAADPEYGDGTEA
jgi:hypothetical protein